MSANHCYHGMEYSEDRTKIAEWAPLIMDGRGDEEPFAATRIVTGTDVDYGALTHLLVKHLTDQRGFDVYYNREVVGLDREADGRWRVSVKDTYDGSDVTVSAKFVFIGGLIIPKMLIDFISDRWTQAKSNEAEKYANDR
jgi:malate dehydrogenase (quinone)